MATRRSSASGHRRTPPPSSSSRAAPATPTALSETLLKIIADIAAVGAEVKSCKRSCWNLSRRVKLLAPLFEEVRDAKAEELPPTAEQSFQSFKVALLHARKILMECCTRSRVYMVMQREHMGSRFTTLNKELSQALGHLPMDALAITDEIQEQAQMVLGQLRRANPLDDAEEEQLHADLMSLISGFPAGEDSLDLSGSFQETSGDSSPVNVAVSGTVMNKLGLTSLPAVKREMEALRHERVKLQEQETKTQVRKKPEQVLMKARSRNGVEDSEEEKRNCERRAAMKKNPLVRSASGVPFGRLSLMRSSSGVPDGQGDVAAGIEDVPLAQMDGTPASPLQDSGAFATMRDVERAIGLLKKLRDSLAGGTIDRTEDDDSGNSHRSSTSVTCSDTGSEEDGVGEKPKESEVPVVISRTGQTLHPPEDFLCPISLEIMRDPVIVSTGQTYDRQFIEHWLKEGHKTCPRTQLLLSQPLVVIPNYSLRSLIQQWCDTHGVDLPKRSPRLRGSSCSDPGAGSCTSQGSREQVPAVDLDVADADEMAAGLTSKLSSLSVDERKQAAAELRLLAKRSDSNRVSIANAGAIEPLVRLLADADQKVQEHAVTSLLNLSIHDENKELLVSAHAIPAIIRVLQAGSMQSRENAAAALFSLSAVDDNKIAIGQAGAIPALVQLLREGEKRGKKDAATALFNLCVHPGNKTRAVRAGLVPALVRLLQDPPAGMLDESLAILSILSSAVEGRDAMGSECIVPILVDITGSGTPRNKENASSVLLTLCSSSLPYTELALSSGAQQNLQLLLRSGTPRAKRKASALLQHFRDYEISHIPVETDTFLHRAAYDAERA